MKPRHWVKIAGITVVGAGITAAIVVGRSDLAVIATLLGTAVTSVATGLCKSPSDAAKEEKER